jgi:DUF971 family protein
LEQFTLAVPSKTSVHPVEIILHQRSKMLEIAFDDGLRAELPCEFLRVHSPSAEVRGHGPGQEVLQAGKREVGITAVEPVGSYAVKLVFTDGHDTGLYSWDYLHELGRNRDAMWKRYLERLEAAGTSRDPGSGVKVHKLQRMDPPPRVSRPPTDE